MRYRGTRQIITAVLVTIFLSISAIGISARFILVTAQDSMNIGAQVLLNGPKEDAIRETSTINVEPSLLPVGGTAMVIIFVRGEFGEPLAGETIRLEVVGPGGVVLTQPLSPTNAEGKTYATISSLQAGLATVHGFVTTYDHEIAIDDFDVAFFEPVPVPLLSEEPQFTAGVSNTLNWSGDPSEYVYQLEIATDENFTQIVLITGWTQSLTYDALDLVDGQIYYYRVRARNAYYVEGEWSNIVYSIQDASPPWSAVDSASLIDGVLTAHVSASDRVSGIALVRIFARTPESNWVYVGTGSGDVVLDLTELEDQSGKIDGEICFASQAVDVVGNTEELLGNSRGDVCLSIEEGEWIPPDGGTVTSDKGKTYWFDELSSYFFELWERMVGLVKVLASEGQLFTLVMLLLAFLVWSISFLRSHGGTLSDVPLFLIQSSIALAGLFGIGAKRKRKGIVYDSVTKEPVRHAVVRLFTGRRLLQTSVTDIHGIYSLSIYDEICTIDVVKAGYLFPSRVVKLTPDGKYEQVYRGGEFTSTEKSENDGEAIEFCIPIDPVELEGIDRIKICAVNVLDVLLTIVVPLCTFLCMVISLSSYFILGEWIYLAIAVIDFVLIVYQVSVYRILKREYGYVVDEEGKPLGGIMVELLEDGTQRVIDKRLTDENGRYRFLATGNTYLVRVTDTRYHLIDGMEPDGVKRNMTRVGKVGKGVIIIAKNLKLRQSSPSGEVAN